MTAAMGVGAVVGGLAGGRARADRAAPARARGARFRRVHAARRARPHLPVELLALALVGWASISFMSTGNSTLQLGADPSMRGRVMSLWFVAFQGSTPIGGPDRRLGDGLAGARAGLGSRRHHVPARRAHGPARAARRHTIRAPRPGCAPSRVLKRAAARCVFSKWGALRARRHPIRYNTRPCAGS